MQAVLTYLNRGMYDVQEASRLTGASPDQIRRWTAPAHTREAIVPAGDEGPLSFHDLVSLWVVRQLRDRGVSTLRIARARARMAAEWHTQHPFAHREFLARLATDGAAIFAEDDQEDWVDVSFGGQRAFQEIITPALESLEFGGDDQLATFWRPATGVKIDPRIQTGSACIDGTRVPTAHIHDLLEAGEDPEDVAEDFDLELDQVLAAEAYEARLRRVA
jgi:uncharacterized protein (DUF433 family)